MENYGLTDPKTGLNSRLLDWNRSFEELIDHAISTPVDAVLFTGDAFKTRDPNPTYQNAFFKGLKKIAGAGIPIIAIPGNHDLPLAPSKKSALETLATLKVPHIHFSKKIDLIKIPVAKTTLQIVTLPFIYKLNICQPSEIRGLSAQKLNQILSQRLENLVSLQVAKMKRNQPRIVMAHLSVEKAVLGSEQMIGFGQDLLLSESFLKNLAVDYIALGHLHKYQTVLTKPLAIYPGSLERIDFSEEKENKGFVEINFTPLKTDWRVKARFIPTQARKFLTLRISLAKKEKDPMTEIIKQIKEADIRETVLRIIIKATDQQARKINELEIRGAV
jgi:exonuclease SbcD